MWRPAIFRLENAGNKETRKAAALDKAMYAQFTANPHSLIPSRRRCRTPAKFGLNSISKVSYSGNVCIVVYSLSPSFQIRYRTREHKLADDIDLSPAC